MGKSVGPGGLRGDRVWVSEIDSHWEVEGKRVRKEVFYGVGAEGSSSSSRSEPAMTQKLPKKRESSQGKQTLKGERVWTSEVDPHWVLEGKRTRKRVSYDIQPPSPKVQPASERGPIMRKQPAKFEKKAAEFPFAGPVDVRNVVEGKRMRKQISYEMAEERFEEPSTRQTSRSASLGSFSSSSASRTRAGKRQRQTLTSLGEQVNGIQVAIEYSKRHKSSRRTLTEMAEGSGEFDSMVRLKSCSTTDGLEGAIEVVTDWGAIEVASQRDVTQNSSPDDGDFYGSSRGVTEIPSNLEVDVQANQMAMKVTAEAGVTEVLPSERPTTSEGKVISRSTSFFDTVLFSPPSTVSAEEFHFKV